MHLRSLLPIRSTLGRWLHRPRTRFQRFAIRGLAAFTLAYLAAIAALSIDGLCDRVTDPSFVVVPGSMVHVDGSLSQNLEGRLEAAVDLCASHECHTILVSGGIGKEKRDEAQAMKAYLIAHGVPDSSIVVDNHGDNTFETARFAAALLRERHLANPTVVSSFFHITRLRLAMSRHGIGLSGHAHSRRYEPRDLYSVVREVVGLVAYWFKPDAA